MVLPVTLTTKAMQENLFKPRGVKECNIHLLYSDISNGNIKKTVSTLSACPYKIVSIHTPAPEPGNYFLIEDICIDNRIKDCLLKIEYICQELGLVAPVVIHSNLQPEYEYLFEDISRRVITLLACCPHICLAIENVSSIKHIDKGYDMLPLLVPRLVDAINDNPTGVRVYSCLDICHTTMVNRLCTLYKVNGICNEAAPTLDDYIRAFAPTCILVHLANTTNFGYGYNHGTAFGRADRELLRTILMKLNGKMPHAKVVLEISEKNFNARTNVIKTLETLSSMEI